MKYLDRSYAAIVTVFFAGAITGAITVVLDSNAADFAMTLLQARMLSPIRTASHFGNLAVFLLIFLNNSVPVVLSFVYPLVITSIKWTPPMSNRRRSLFFASYSFIVAFFTGFFSLGAPLAISWMLVGSKAVPALFSEMWIHGPLELALVLACVAEPLRLAWVREGVGSRGKLVGDRGLLAFSIAGLLVAAAMEVFLRV
jgi:hypothetical protein